MLTLAVVAGAIGAVGAAGLLRDRLRGRRRPAPPDVASANNRLSHYARVRDSEQQHGWYGGPPPL